MREIRVPPGTEPMPAEKYVRRLLAGVPGHVLRDLWRRRDVKRGGVRLNASDTVYAGDVLLIYLPEGAAAEEPDIVYEDDRVLLLHKPRGISVSDGDVGERTLTTILGARIPGIQPCHRLDHHTGGLVLFAKDEAAHAACLSAMRNRTLEKGYECLVRGVPTPRTAEARAYLLKSAEGVHVTVTDQPMRGALSIITRYRVTEAGNPSRLSVTLVTGRTHQIRAHMAYLGHPILGDDKYGDHAWNRAMGARRQMLWATALTFCGMGELTELEGRTFRVKAPF